MYAGRHCNILTHPEPVNIACECAAPECDKNSTVKATGLEKSPASSHVQDGGL